MTARPPSSASYLDRDVITNVETGVDTVERQDGFDTHWDLIRHRYLYELHNPLWIPMASRQGWSPAAARR